MKIPRFAVGQMFHLMRMDKPNIWVDEIIITKIDRPGLYNIVMTSLWRSGKEYTTDDDLLCRSRENGWAVEKFMHQPGRYTELQNPEVNLPWDQAMADAVAIAIMHDEPRLLDVQMNEHDGYVVFRHIDGIVVRKYTTHLRRNG